MSLLLSRNTDLLSTSCKQVLCGALTGLTFWVGKTGNRHNKILNGAVVTVFKRNKVGQGGLKSKGVGSAPEIWEGIMRAPNQVVGGQALQQFGWGWEVVSAKTHHEVGTWLAGA